MMIQEVENNGYTFCICSTNFFKSSYECVLLAFEKVFFIEQNASVLKLVPVWMDNAAAENFWLCDL